MFKVAPRSTYRVQLHAGFDFDDAARIVGYLADLGISHLYCSPYLQAIAGSTHGYDVADPTTINAELGGPAGRARLVEALQVAGMSHILDIVPNHMAADPANPWWWDVLEKGPGSRYARFFDIDWTGPDGTAGFRVLVPILADQYGRVLEAGELGVERDGGNFRVRYHDEFLPLSATSLGELLGSAAQRAGDMELAAVARGFAATPPAVTDDPVVAGDRDDRARRLSADLARLLAGNQQMVQAIDEELSALSADVDRLDELLRHQNYRLAYWRTASEELDYRRFFNIETLVGVRIEDPDVFAATHQLVINLVRDGSIDGLRIDHIDGLRDPEGYLIALAEECGGVYTVAEKVLDYEEALPATWLVAGTSGYDFLNRANNLFVATRHEHAMSACYAEFTGESASFDEIAYLAKQQIMSEDLRVELEHLVRLLAQICEGFRRHRDHTRRHLRDTLREVVARFPVYRTYVEARRPSGEADRAHVAAAVATAQASRPDLDAELIDFIGQLALGLMAGNQGMEFAQRLQQFTGPVMAKGVEDTAFYRYNRLLSLNEVGGNPAVFGRPVESFHADTALMAAHWPEAMLTLSTHDTKRSADVRARLNVLSEVPTPWANAVARWGEINDRHRRGHWPDRNAEYLLYQTLVGAWPVDATRATAFMTKATKEAKEHTSWVDPVAEYDRAVSGFVGSILADEVFVADLTRFLIGQRVVGRGRRNSLAQTTLALTCPGVPDIYQGTETWDLSLVDPDNRRPVDYDLRRGLLAGMRFGRSVDVVGTADEGHPKLWLIHALLQDRRRRPELYLSSSYEPLTFRGARADDLVGFSRGALAVVVPRLGGDRWEETAVQLPAGRWTDVLTGADHDGGRQALDRLFPLFPVAILARSNG